MNRLLTLLAGPEMYWTVLYLGTRWFAARNIPATDAGNHALNQAAWLLAVVGIPLSFALMAIPAGNRWILLARLAVAGFFGLNACVLRICDGIDYPELGRNSGLMGLWIMATMAGAAAWCLSAVVTWLLLRGAASGSPT